MKSDIFQSGARCLVTVFRHNIYLHFLYLMLYADIKVTISSSPSPPHHHSGLQKRRVCVASLTNSADGD